MGRPRIFVSIANYRDPEIIPTLQSLFSMAQHPERVFVGVLSQVDVMNDHVCIPYKHPQIRQHTMDYRESQGITWARSNIFNMFLHEEDYVLQIDSHSRFAPGWDELALDNWYLCGDFQAYLAHYPPAYTPETGCQPLRYHQQTFKKFDSDGLPVVHTKVLENTNKPARVQRNPMFAGGCYFAPSRLVRQVPYDPYLYFNGEEITQAVRLFTHGFNGYTPHHSFMWHYYRKAGDNVRRLHWEDHSDHASRQKIARDRIKHLLNVSFTNDAKALNRLGEFGLGLNRSLHDYEAFAGISFRNQFISDRAMNGEFGN